MPEGTDAAAAASPVPQSGTSKHLGEAAPRRRYGRLAAYAVAFSVLSIVLVVGWWQGARWGEAWASLRSLPVWALPLALGLHIMAHVWWAARVALLARCFDASMPWWTAWRIVTAGVFGGAVTPGKLGGEGLKLAVLVRSGVAPTQASRLLLTDRSIDLLFFITLGLGSVVVLPPLFGADAATARSLAAIGSAFLALFLVLLVLLLAAPRVMGRGVHVVVGRVARLVRKDAPDLEARAERFLRDVRAGIVAVYRRRPAVLAAAVLFTAINWLAEYAVLWTLLRAFGYDVPYWAVFFAGVVLTLVANIPVTPGGSGVAEVAALALLVPLAPGLTAAFVVAWRGMTYYYDLVVGGVVASWTLPRRLGSVRPNGSGPF